MRLSSNRCQAMQTRYLIDWDCLEAIQWQKLLDTLALWTELYPDVEVTYFVEPEGASKTLLQHVADSQLVIVGNRGRNVLAVRCWAPPA